MCSLREYEYLVPQDDVRNVHGTSVAVCRRVLQYVAACRSVLKCVIMQGRYRVLSLGV